MLHEQVTTLKAQNDWLMQAVQKLMKDNESTKKWLVNNEQWGNELERRVNSLSRI